jgi:hypothetical protein
MAAVIVLISAAFLAFPASAGEYITTHNLPEGYVELEYIECDGRQGINTGMKATPKTAFEVTFQVTNTSVGAAKEEKDAGYGGNGTYAGIVGVNWGGGGGTGSLGRFQISYGRTDPGFSVALGPTANKEHNKDTEKHTVFIDAANSRATFDGTEVIASSENIVLNDDILTIIGIGAVNYKSSQTDFACSSRCAAKIFYVKITNDGAAAGEFIPAYRVADQKVGMYDLVTKTFFENVHETVLKDDTGAETSRTLHGFAMPADAVLTAPAATTGSSGTSGSSTTSPATGDNTVYLFTAVAAAAAVLCIAVVSVSRRAFAGKQD